ncbi:hypothetical protein P3T76_000129 [Phytophthora citrophthora]|uniref:Uncharacterized protein n=1 Tax=Phytophthora citrophthora TaxID=4793 RepID=A0AAD9H010_9STRA|nr:hypothetical protein P3T76_000129 [Phytophthora citrophthora]
MRMRLRAPDEPEAENGYDFGDTNASAPSTPDHTHLPPLDVGSPEYIEERLENLKRRPNWSDYLDQYVEDHPDSDSEDGDLDDISTVDNAGLIRSTLWSLLVVAFAPLLILIAPCLKHKSYGFWPLGCRSMKELFSCALANVIFMVFGLVLLYWVMCRELPDVFNSNNTLVKLNVQVDEFQRATDTCHAALLQWERMVAQELCMPVGIDVALLLLNTLLLLHYHRQWARYLMILMAVMFVVDVPTKLYDATFPFPEIHQVDPTFAMVDEEILVALDGKNLKPGGSVAWVAYWGCATTSNVDACDKQFTSTFEAGNVAVTFKSLDHFIPCYRDPPNPLKAQDYQCFEDIRIRVKDMQSIPGWSRTAPASVEFQAVNTEALSFKQEVQMDHNTVHPEPRETESSLNTVKIEIDISPTGESSSETPLTTRSEETELKENTVTLSDESAQENESESESSLEADNTEAVTLDEEMKEAEVMPEAVVKLRAIDRELENTSQSEGDLASVEEVLQELQELATKVEELRASGETHVDVEVDESKVYEEDMPGYSIEDPDFSMSELLLEDGVVNEEILIIDDEEELSTMVVVVDEESVQAVPNSDQELELVTEMEKYTGQSIFEAQSDKVTASPTTTQEQELELVTEEEEHTGSSTFKSQSDEASTAGTVEEEGELTQNTEPSTYEAHSEEVSTPTAVAKDEEVELATKVAEHTEPSYEIRPGEVSTTATSAQEEELELVTEMEEDTMFEDQSDEADVLISPTTAQEEEEMELTIEAEKHTERSTFQSGEVGPSINLANEEEKLELETGVEKHPKPSTYEAQSDEVSSAAIALEEDLTPSGSKEILSSQEDTTSPAKKALSKLSEALSKISDSSGFASTSETISKKQKHSTRQGPRSRHTKKSAEPANVAAAENTAVAV